MKNKIKKMSIIASALCAVVACTGLLGACGEKIDYSSLDYSGWAELGDSTWDKKDISYQIELPRISKGGGGGTGIGAANSFLINLYADGTMVFLQAGLYITGATMKDAAWVDEDRHIAWDYYGFWVENEDKTAINLYYICACTDEGVTVQTDSSWVNKEAYCYGFQIGSENGKYVLTQSADTEVALRYLNMSTNGESFPIGFTTAEVWSGSDIKYKTIQSWIDTFIDEDFAEV